MSDYYHEITVRVFDNYWPFIAMTLLIGVVVLGIFKYSLKDSTERYIIAHSTLKCIGRRRYTISLRMYSIISGIVFAVMVYAESYLGVYQVCLNNLSVRYYSPLYFRAATIVVVATAGLLFGVITFILGIFAETARCGYLVRKVLFIKRYGKKCWNDSGIFSPRF